MTMASILSRYLARRYFFNLLLMLGALLAIVYLFDTVELLRRAGKQEDVTLPLILKMGLLKLPEVGQMILPFAILFSAIFTFWQLTRRLELVVVRAAGFSVWQFLSPVLFVAVAFGILQITAINPVGTVLLSKFEQMENYYLANNRSHVSLFEEGFWLRQDVTDNAGSQGYAIIHAGTIKMPDWRLQDVMALFFDGQDNFRQRIDAPAAGLQNQSWVFYDPAITRHDGTVTAPPDYSLPTSLTGQEIEESFASPDAISVWRLPAFIRMMEATGFDATRLKIHFHALLAQPLLFASMILLAAAVAMRPPRFRGTMMMIVAGILIGFITFFMASFLQALGASQQIPSVLAAWSPALVMFLLGLAAMLNLEDG